MMLNPIKAVPMKLHLLLRFFVTLTFVAISIFSYAYDFEVDGIYYSINQEDKTTVSVTYRDRKFDCYSGSVQIPTTVTYNGQEYLVTCIDSEAFELCPNLTSVTIPESITHICSYAFSGSYSLTSIVIPNSVTKIDGGVFYACSGLRSVRLPNGLTTISASAFRECTQLTSVNIPNSVTSINTYAFRNCNKLESITIPSSVTDIGNYAFQYCINLKEVYCMAKQVPNTNTNAFDGDYLESITLYVPEAAIEDYKATAPWSNFPTIKKSYLVGDVNGNGEVEIGDVTSVLTLMATPEATGYNNQAADANGNGEIEIGDVTTILTIMADGE